MTPSVALALVLTLAIGVALGVAAAPTLTGGDGTADPTAGDLADAQPDRTGAGELTDLPPDLQVTAETVRLGAGFGERHTHAGPTFNFIQSGLVRITDDAGTTDYGPGGFFFEPADYAHDIEIVTDARIDVLRLLPEGAEGTTRVE